MDGGSACVRCDSLHEGRPEACLDCGHEFLEPLTFSEYRRRRRGGQTPATAPSVNGPVLQAVAITLSLALVAVGLTAVGVGVASMTSGAELATGIGGESIANAGGELASTLRGLLADLRGVLASRPGL
jgi:hypothetical protein